MPEAGTTWEQCRPLQQNTGLFRSFTWLNGQHEILKFADRHGQLGIADPKRSQAAGFSRLTAPELLGDWESAIYELRAAVRLWDAISLPGHEYLKKVIKWKKGPNLNGGMQVLYDCTDSEWRLMARIDTTGFQVKYGDLVLPAYLHLQEVINTMLDNHVAPQMLWDYSNELKLFHAPKTLLGAMWLQFADAVTYKLEYRECGWCGKPFEVTRSTRSDRLYCSNSCRSSAGRKRARTAGRK